MDQNCFLIYGSNGFLGKELISELKRQKKPFKKGLARIENRDELIKEIDLINPSRIICMAGLTGKPNISWFEANQIEGIRINILGQLNISDVANQFNLHCTLLSTGVIYNYDDKHPINSGIGFKEEDEPNYSGNFYCICRILEEKHLKSFSNVLNLRISYPTTGTLNPNSFLSKLASFQNIESVPLSVTVVDDLWPILVDLSEKKITGTFNFNNHGTISHQEILEMYKSLVDKNHEWKKNPVSLKNRGACELDVTKLSSFGYNIPDVKESFKRLIEKYKLEKDKLININNQAIEGIIEKKKILITGGASNLVFEALNELIKLNEFDLIVVDKSSNINWNKDELDQFENNLKIKIEYFQIDLSSKSFLNNLFQKNKIHAVFHFELNSGKQKQENSIIETSELRFISILNLLKCMDENNFKKLIFISSGKQSNYIDEFFSNLNISKKEWSIIFIRIPKLITTNDRNKLKKCDDLDKTEEEFICAIDTSYLFINSIRLISQLFAELKVFKIDSSKILYEITKNLSDSIFVNCKDS